MSRVRSQGPSETTDPWLYQAVEAMVRGNPEKLEGLLVSVGTVEPHEGTRTTTRTHLVRKDPSGRPRVEALAEWLAQRIVDYCIPRSRINEASEDFLATGSTAAMVRLATEAKSLFAIVEKSGEGGELLLYALLEFVLKIPQILCKMPLKTNSMMHVHGSDGIHAKMLENGNLALYWGESKLHKNAKSAIDSCFQSLYPFLTEGLDGVARRDVLLVRDNLDAGAEEVTAALIKYFDQEASQSANVELRAGCLVGFDMDEYPDSANAAGSAVSDAVGAAQALWHERVADRISHHKLTSFEIELFCVPMPSVEIFRKTLMKKLSLG